MKKDLFEDLLSSNIDERYNKQGEEFDLNKKQEELSEKILKYAKSKMDLKWAQNVVLFFNEICNEPLLESNPNKNTLDSIYAMANKIIEEDKQNKIKEQQRKFEEKQKQQKEYENNCKKQAQIFDEKIVALYKKEPNTFWCDNVDLLAKEFKKLHKDVVSFLTNKDKLNQMIKNVEFVKLALNFDSQISLWENVPQNEHWSNEVLSLNNKIQEHKNKDKFLQYMTKYDDLEIFVKLAEAFILNSQNQKIKDKQDEEFKLKLEQEYQQELQNIEDEERQQELQEQRQAQEQQQREINRRKYNIQHIKNSLLNYIKSVKYKPFDLEEKKGVLRLKYWRDSKIIDFTVPEGIEEIAGSAFRDCKKIRSVELPLTLEKIGGYAFFEQQKLKNIVFKDNIKHIGQSAFAYCENLKSVHLPSSVQTIEDGVFCGCKKLQEITVDRDNPYFCSVDGHLYSKDKKKFYQYCPARKEKFFKLDDATVQVAEHAFSWAQNLEHINFNNVEKVLAQVILQCKNLKKLDMPNVKQTSDSFYFKCKKLKTINYN